MTAASLTEQARAMEGDLVALRRDLHRIPELAFEEHKTAARVAEALRAAGVEFTAGIAKTGIVAVVEPPNPKGTICLRADMDALPMQEANAHGFVSTHKGAAHMCGHDAHMTCLTGAARLLNARKSELKYRVKFLYQPSEEKIPGGAPSVLDSGALDDVEAIFGLHCQPALPVGRFETCPGPMMGAADRFVVKVHGKGGHAATPHLCVDPIVAASHLVMQLQTLVSRHVSPADTLVVTVGRFSGGDTFNVIPDAVELEGTVRTLSIPLHDRFQELFTRVVTQALAAYGCTATVDYQKGYPPLVNDPSQADFVAGVLRRAFGEASLDYPAEPKMYGEDFSYYLRKIPGCFFMLGVGNPERGIVSPLHSPTFDLDERALTLGATALAELVLAYNAPDPV